MDREEEVRLLVVGDGGAVVERELRRRCRASARCGRTARGAASPRAASRSPAYVLLLQSAGADRARLVAAVARVDDDGQRRRRGRRGRGFLDGGRAGGLAARPRRRGGPATSAGRRAPRARSRETRSRRCLPRNERRRRADRRTSSPGTAGRSSSPGSAPGSPCPKADVAVFAAAERRSTTCVVGATCTTATSIESGGGPAAVSVHVFFAASQTPVAPASGKRIFSRKSGGP